MRINERRMRNEFKNDSKRSNSLNMGVTMRNLLYDTVVVSIFIGNWSAEYDEF